VFALNIENIEAFVYVIHCGSFNKAAEALYLSQPSVTARIKSLEQELGCKLFDRMGKQIQISEDGKRFLPYAQQLLLVYKTGKLHINQKKSQPNEYRIGCTVSAANYIIPDLLPYLKERFPAASYKLVSGTTDDIVNKVLNKEVDIGLVRKSHHPGLQSVKLYVDPIRLYVYKESITVEQVAEQPLVFFECGSLDWLRIHRVFEALEQPPNIQIQTDNSEMARKLIVRKSGIGFLPGLSVRQEAAEGLLYPLLLPETEGIALQTNLVVSPGEHTELFEAIAGFGKKLSALDS
jgi:DNA-binding transcriptional LysR family regulator